MSLIVAALAAGAAAGMKDTATQAVKDAYAALRGRLAAHYSKVDVGPLERRPDSEAKRGSLAEDLGETNVADDPKVIELAERLVALVRESAPEVGPAIGVDLADVEAAFLSVRGVSSDGIGVRVERGRFQQGIEIQDIKAGRRDQPQDP